MILIKILQAGCIDVINMYEMLYEAVYSNKDLNLWDISKIKTKIYISFHNTGKNIPK